MLYSQLATPSNIVCTYRIGGSNVRGDGSSDNGRSKSRLAGRCEPELRPPCSASRAALVCHKGTMFPLLMEDTP